MSHALDDRGWRGVVEQPERTLFDAALEAELVEPATIEGRFLAFHHAHPEVYAKLVEYALDLKRRGWDHFGISVVWERLRYETMLGHRPDEDQPYRLNDHFRSRFARLIIDQEPELAEVFEVRALRSASPPPPCASCRAGSCRNCHGPSCGHACDVSDLL